jgi:toxin ParE1/3/4
LTKKLIFSPKAIAELREIGEYIARDNLRAAISVIDKLKKRCQNAVDSPSAGRKRDELQPGLRSLTEGDYVIFYRFLGKDIEIAKVVHGKRNIEKLFKQKL